MFLQAQALGPAKLASLGERMRDRRQQLRDSSANATRIRVKREILRHLA